MKKKYWMLSLLILAISCAPTQQLKITDADLIVAQQRVPNITINDLQLGYKLYVRHCTGCHKLYAPEKYTASKWQPILKKMFVKSKMEDEQEKQKITDYIMAKCK